MKKILVFLVVLAMLAPTAVFAEEQELEFRYNDEGDGYIMLTAVKNPSDITVLEIPPFYDGKTVRGIADNSFMLMDNLKSLVLPQGIEYVGTYAFSDCAQLESVSIPSSVTSIGDYAFSACNLQNVDLHEYISFIGDNAFSLNEDAVFFVTDRTYAKEFAVSHNLNHATKEPAKPFEIVYTVDENGNATVTGGRYFEIGNITIPATTPEGHPVVALADGAFKGYENVTEIKICENLVSIGKDVFADCPRLESVMMDEAPIKTIGDGAFRGCGMLAEIGLPDTVEYIGNWAFAECDIFYVELSPSIKEMGHYAFDNNVDIEFQVQEGSYAELFVSDREYRYTVRKKDGSVEEVDVKRSRGIVSLACAVVIGAVELLALVYAVNGNKSKKKPLYKSRLIK